MAAVKGKTGGFIWNFCFGLFFGCCITYATVKFSRFNVLKSSSKSSLVSHNGEEVLLKPDGHVVVDDTNRVLESELKHFEHSHHHNFVGEDAIAQVLYDKVRVLCWIMTGPQNIDKKAVHIYATWGKRCNKVIFISSEPSDKVPVVKVNTNEGRDYLWQKTRAAFQHIYDNLLDDFDWFLKADDDTFVIVENLRYFLSSYSPDNSIYFGHKFKPYVKQGYMSGGGGYVTSRVGVKNLVDIAFSDPSKCKSRNHRGGAEDVEIGKCLENAGVKAGDSRDSLQRNRFHPFQPEAHLNPSGLPEKFWYWSYIYYPRNEGFQGCCSDYSITFHYIPPAALYNLEYLVYHLRPFGKGTHYLCPADLPKEIFEEARSRQQLQQQEQPLDDHPSKQIEQGKPSPEESQPQQEKETKVENLMANENPIETNPKSDGDAIGGGEQEKQQDQESQPQKENETASHLDNERTELEKHIKVLEEKPGEQQQGGLKNGIEDKKDSVR